MASHPEAAFAPAIGGPVIPANGAKKRDRHRWASVPECHLQPELQPEFLGVLQLDSAFLARTLIALEFVGNGLTFMQAIQIRTFNGRDVHEHVLAAVSGLNEAEALGGVEPFDSTGSHFQPP